MKYLIVFATVAQSEKKMPSRHPLQRLNKLTKLSAELMNDWFTFLPSKDAWVNKFATNAERIAKNFERGNHRCGFYDNAHLSHGEQGKRKRREAIKDTFRYDTTDPSIGAKQITTGFSQWAQRYIGQCSGQRNNQYQVQRMARWNSKLQAHLAGQNEKGSRIRMFLSHDVSVIVPIMEFPEEPEFWG